MSRYLIVSAQFLTTGGQDRANYALASYLARQGHEVHLVAHEVSPDLFGQGNVTWHRVRKPLGSTLLGEPWLNRIGSRLARDITARGGRVIVNGGNCAWGDVNWVHYVHSAYERQADGALRALRYRIAHRRFVRNERRALSAAKLVIANSQRTARELEMRLGIDPNRIHVIYYGIDPDIFQPVDLAKRQMLRQTLAWTKPAVLFVGALGDRRKGFDTLYRAWKLLCEQRNWNAVLYVVGRGAQMSMWKSRTRTHGLSDRIRFLGFRNDVPDLLRSADAMVAPTRYEAYGLAVHEAICCGLPAFVSANAGVAERYPQELQDLLLPDPEDAEDLAKRLRQWRERRNDHLLASVAQFGAQLRNRTWDNMVEEICLRAGLSTPSPNPLGEGWGEGLRASQGDSRTLSHPSPTRLSSSKSSGVGEGLRTRE